VTIYQTEEEQVEALKKWWSENGRSIIAGVVIGLGGVLGWQAWTRHQDSLGAQGAAGLQQMTSAMQSGSTQLAVAQGEQLMKDFQGSAYGMFAALNLAKLEVDAGDDAKARAHLDWAKANAPDQGLRDLARLRLVRVMLDMGDLDAADAELAEPFTPSFAARAAELRGDLSVARGDIQAARTAYQQALESDSGDLAVVQMKLDDLALAP
jgi:predicted negative regulator of RcsB-dependent stress response